MAYNSDFFDLSQWKVTLPVDESGGVNGDADEEKQLEGFESEFFYDAADSAMVFEAHHDGATTKGSSYARSELRERADGKDAYWSLNEGGTLTATLRIDEMPFNHDGSMGRIIVDQIHGRNDELVRLYYDNGELYFQNEHAGASNDELTFRFTNEQGEEPEVELGEMFSYHITAKGDTLLVQIHADGQTYNSETTINDVWQTDEFYFKAGLYMGINEEKGYGDAKVSFYGLDVGHGTGEGMEGWITTESVPEPPVIETPETEITKTIRGNNDANTLQSGSASEELKGYGGNDLLWGGDGDDFLWGNDGDDTLNGGAGNDTLKGSNGDDVFVFSSRDDSLEFSMSHDRILDFNPGQDIIDLSTLGFTGLDTDGGRTEEGELRVAYSARTDRSYIRSDQDDFEFFLVGDYRGILSDSDFIFV